MIFFLKKLFSEDKKFDEVKIIKNKDRMLIIIIFILEKYNTVI